MDIAQILDALTPDIVARFKTAIELGKWPNGVALTSAQKETCMQAIVIWDAKNLPAEARTGYIDRGSKQKDETCSSTEHVHDHAAIRNHDDEERPLKLI